MKNKNIIIFTSVLCMIPVILSTVLFQKLPEQIAVHWNSAGEVDGYLPKVLAAFGLPFFFLLVNIYSKIRLLYDPRREGHGRVLRAVSIWAVPITSLILIPATLFMAIGVKIPISTISFSVTGILFIIIGNYLPKNRRNYVIGVKLPWTFHDADNWNKTNRLAGHIMVAGGIIILVSGYLQQIAVLHGVSIVVIAVLIIVIPFFYSFALYKKEQDKNPIDGT